MWTITTTDGRKYHYGSFEACFLAARTLFGWDGYKITDEDTGDEITSKVRDKERKM